MDSIRNSVVSGWCVVSFDEHLREGLLGEGLITRWLNGRGWDVLPAYEIETQTGKGPRLFSAKLGKLIAPDLLVFKDSSFYWVEAKTKSAFTWHRITETFQTGIDRRHWLDYLAVGETTGLPVWLLFLHRPGSSAKDTPAGMESPSGLYGQVIDILKETIDHEHANHGPSGMVYWQENTLKKICEYEQMMCVAAIRECG